MSGSDKEALSGAVEDCSSTLANSDGRHSAPEHVVSAESTRPQHAVHPRSRRSARSEQPLSEADLATLIGAIYDAALKPAEWPACLNQLARSLGAFLPTFFTHDVRSDHGGVGSYSQLSPGLQRQYTEYFAERNVLLTYGRRLLVPGSVRTSQMMCEQNILLASEYYNDFMRPLEIFHALGATIQSDGSRTYNLTMFRGKRAEPFRSQELAFLRALLPHFQRAIGIQERLAASDVRSSAVADVFDRLPDGVLLVAGNARIILANRAADTILRSADGLSAERGELAAARPTETRALRDAIALAARTSAGDGRAAGRALALSRPSSLRPLSVVVSPIRFKDGEWRPAQRDVAAVFVTDPETAPCVDEEYLRSTYNLTPAEARVAKALAKGDSLEEASSALAISVDTARTHLKRIFSKTCTNRQAELVRLLLAGTPRVEP